jgi:uncharacterized protein (DUF362 family)/Pyruvate/2-oxoacid:ferredoxin oxidoreductase delta subunit
MNPPRVSLVRHDDYEPASLLESIRTLLEPLGGMEAFVRPGDRVVLKPNIIDGRAPDLAVTTHPEVVRAVACLALDCGARVAMGDSPGRQSLRVAAGKSGFNPVMEDLGLDWAEFTPLERATGEDGVRKLTLARELVEADLVINIPKLKTHCMMFMTMAVKNLFGAVIGLRKFQWHLRAGRDKALFGRVLYEICSTVAPGLSIVDAVVSMDGDGPTSGKPNPTGFLAAGRDPSAVDAILMDVLGLDRNELFTLRAAAEAGDRAWEDAVTVGAAPEELTPGRWVLPASESAELPLPSFCHKIPFLREWLREQTTVHPYAIEEPCVLCGECVRICPAQVMTMTSTGIAIDQKVCIRCYCCHEICPHSAIGLRKGLLARVAGMFRS